MDVIHARSDFVRVFELFKRLQQLHVRTRGFNGDHVRIQRGNRIHDVVELAVAHMGVDLGIIPRHRGIDPEGFHAPLQISIPVATLERQSFTQRRLINLDDTDTGRLQIRHFVTQRQRNLFGDGFATDVFTRE